MSLNPREVLIFSNQFGEITDKRVIYFTKKNWFSGIIREYIPLRQIVFVRYETNQSFLGCLFWLSLGCFWQDYLKFLFCAIGLVLFFFGYPQILVITAGGTASPSVGLFWEIGDAEKFVSVLRNQIVND
jgi:hypothetical protein